MHGPFFDPVNWRELVPFLVEFEGTEELVAIANNLDLDGLAELAKSRESTV
ncbi:MAG: hypothetical protein PVI11_09150 [Candidatus Aminicenantes bacterium]